MKPFNALFVFIYYLVGFISAILHPTEVIGMEDLPRSGVLLCPNHASNWDPILVALRLPVNYRLHIMAKEELFHYPVLGWILKRVGAFPVSRGNNDIQSVKTAIQAIKAGDNLLIFPEGTVIRNGIGCADGLPAHAKGGVAMMNYSISDTAEYGEYVSGTRVLPYEETKANMKAVLRDIRDGTFAGKWIAENKNGRTFFNSKRALLAQHPMETVGAELRKNMLWGDDVDPDTASN